MPMYKQHIAHKFPILIETDEEGAFILSCPTFRGCRSYGETIEEGMRNIREVLEICMEEDPAQHSNRFVELRELEVSA